ncbi:hypothetical protein D3C72_2147680 [compost metagenome]
MAHGPAALLIGKAHPGKSHADRHLCLQPTAPLVIGVKNVSAYPHGDQTLAGTGDVAEHRMLGKAGRNGRLGQAVGKNPGLLSSGLHASDC